MAAKRPEPTPAAQELEEIGRQRAAFTARRKDLLDAQILFEQSGIRPQEAKSGPDAREMATALLDGHANAAERDPSDGEKLHAIIVEKQAIEIALDVLSERENAARRIAAAEMIQETAAEWRTIVRRRALAAIELRKANEEAASFRESVRLVGKSTPSLVCDPVSGPVFGPKIVGDSIYTFLQACVHAGIVSLKEI